jgi:cbb3-type cytochrome oxidase maturation protein
MVAVPELAALILGQFLVSLLVGLAGLCAFVWAVASGLLDDVERTKHQVLEVEGVDRDA